MVRTHYNPKLKHFARKLRKSGTLAEAILWQELKGRKIKGYQFTRQKPIGDYIVDFYCPRLSLAVEVDGVSHDERLERDKIRQTEIEKQGFRFLRFLESDVRHNLPGVIAMIEHWIERNERQKGKNLNSE
ncbi:MAG: endonuclease domain-containing protein [Gemmatimonadota bacterium]|nr:MAG: endonuclease domain-containing protein [Gemmatimonadota bacterium]